MSRLRTAVFALAATAAVAPQTASAVILKPGQSSGTLTSGDAIPRGCNMSWSYGRNASGYGWAIATSPNAACRVRVEVQAATGLWAMPAAAGWLTPTAGVTNFYPPVGGSLKFTVGVWIPAYGTGANAQWSKTTGW